MVHLFCRETRETIKHSVFLWNYPKIGWREHLPGPSGQTQPTRPIEAPWLRRCAGFREADGVQPSGLGETTKSTRSQIKAHQKHRTNHRECDKATSKLHQILWKPGQTHMKTIWKPGWWLGTWLLFFHPIGNVIISIDELIFFRGGETTKIFHGGTRASHHQWIVGPERYTIQ